MLFSVIQNWYLGHQLKVIATFIGSKDRVLDFGCGDLTLSGALLRIFPKIKITGIDVVDSGRRERGIEFLTYDGKKLPFKNKTFNTTLSYHVLHHTEDPESSLREIARVTKKNILLIEPVKRFKFEQQGISLMDNVLNLWREEIDMPHHFLSKREWNSLFRKLKLTVVTDRSAGVFPAFLPIGETRLFVLEI